MDLTKRKAEGAVSDLKNTQTDKPLKQVAEAREIWWKEFYFFNHPSVLHALKAKLLKTKNLNIDTFILYYLSLIHI